jgi:ankyrin repeat protein
MAKWIPLFAFVLLLTFIYWISVSTKSLQRSSIDVAIVNRDVSSLRKWQTEGSLKESLELRNEFSETPLMVAVDRGTLEIVAFLLEQGASIKVRDQFGNGLIHRVRGDQAKEVFQLLLSRGLSLDDCTGFRNDTALSLACQQGDVSVTSILLENGANCLIPDRDGRLPIHHAAVYSARCLDLLLKQDGIKIDAVDQFGCTPLLLAVWMNPDSEQSLRVSKLLDAGADVNFRLSGIIPDSSFGLRSSKQVVPKNEESVQEFVRRSGKSQLITLFEKELLR